MNGQLSEIHLSELIREISLKRISGRLQLQRNKARVAIYFNSGLLTFAACNLTNLRLGAYLVKNRLISDEVLLYLGKRTRDFDLARSLISERRISETQVQQVQLKQSTDILRLALLWTEGTWEFDNRSHLNEIIPFNLDVPNLLLETTRRLPRTFINSRFRNSAEMYSIALPSPTAGNLLPVESFLLSRFYGSTSLNDLVLVSGIPEAEVQQILFSLAIVGFISRQSWKHAFRDVQEAIPEPVEPVAVVEPEVKEEEVGETAEAFLERLASAHGHYEVLNVPSNATMSELKNAYYDLARRYHPDLFRGSAGSLVSRIESAFARITQAYDTLRDSGQRATYDSKLEAQRRVAKLAEAAPKATSEVVRDTAQNLADGSTLTAAQSAEVQFKEGFAALELGQRNVAMGLLGTAARAFPNEPRYRAYYGRCLAMQENTRRLAETELQAAVKLDPNNAEYRIMLAELYRDLGFIVRARSEAERAVASDQNSRKARELLRSLN